MNDIQLKLDEKNHGGFVIEENAERLAEMEISISDEILTVHHTEVSEKLKGQGIGKKLFDAMVDFARKQQLKVIALCPFAYATFKRHPEQYADIWMKSVRPKDR